MNEAPERATRKPTGKPPWPMILLAGGEKSGKSWSAAQFSASEMVGRTFFIEVGEHYADEYGAIPGVRYQIVPHDGTYRDIHAAVLWATKQPRVDGKPNVIIFDSGTVLWDMLSDQAQRTANRRWRKKNPNAPEPEDEIQITMDLWNTAKDRFAEIARLLYQHDGPSIITARLEQVAVIAAGKPTNEKAWKVRAEKNLPFEVDVVVQAREPRTFQITGLRSTRLELPVGKTIPLPGFTVEGLLRKLGLDQEGATAPRSVTLPRPDDAPPQKPQQQSFQLTPDQQRQLANWKRDLAILIGKKLGPEAARKRHAVMSQRFQRTIASFDHLSVIELRTALRELDGMRDFVPPRDEARYNQLHAQLAAAPLDLIDPIMHAAIEARDAGQITDEQWKLLDDLSGTRATALFAQESASAPQQEEARV